MATTNTVLVMHPSSAAQFSREPVLPGEGSGSRFHHHHRRHHGLSSADAMVPLDVLDSAVRHRTFCDSFDSESQERTAVVSLDRSLEASPQSTLRELSAGRPSPDRRVDTIGGVATIGTVGEGSRLPEEAGDASSEDEDEEEDLQSRATANDAGAPHETGRWSPEEHARFLEGLKMYGRRKWQKIAELVGSRTTIQVRSHAQKYFKKLRKESEAGGGVKGRTHSKIQEEKEKTNVLWLIEQGEKHAHKPKHSAAMSTSSSSSSSRGGVAAASSASSHRHLPTGAPALSASSASSASSSSGSHRHHHHHHHHHRSHHRSHRSSATSSRVQRTTIGDFPTGLSRGEDLAVSHDIRRKRRTLDDLCAVASAFMLEDDEQEQARAKRPSLGERPSFGGETPPSAKLPLSRCPTVEVNDDYRQEVRLPARLELPVAYRTSPFQAS